jgi:hypothetical protein
MTAVAVAVPIICKCGKKLAEVEGMIKAHTNVTSPLVVSVRCKWCREVHRQPVRVI